MKKSKNAAVCKNLSDPSDKKLFSNIVCPVNIKELEDGILPGRFL